MHATKLAIERDDALRPTAPDTCCGCARRCSNTSCSLQAFDDLDAHEALELLAKAPSFARNDQDAPRGSGRYDPRLVPDTGAAPGVPAARFQDASISAYVAARSSQCAFSTDLPGSSSL